MTHHYQDHDQHYVAVDNIIFGFDAPDLKLLLIRRKFQPCMGQWSLMGGFVKKDESLDQAAARVVEELTGLQNVFMEQVHTYGAVQRDTEARTISVAYFTLINTADYDPALGLKHGAEWFDIKQFPPLIFDHQHMVEKALQVLRRKSRTEPLGFNLLPEKFTIPQLRVLYEAINQTEFDPGNFSKKLKAMNVLVKLDEKDKTSSKKGAYYYRFDQQRYEELVARGLAFSL
ncbi:MAG: NUDIX domain-containing protein [Bacteroidetes bacterium]|nr:MAG: NUDIX domain-containing protein [Bacteroidota bacterium]